MTRNRTLPPAAWTGGLGLAFVRDLEKDYRAHGAEMIATLSKNEPRNYARLLQSIAPQNVNAEERWLNQFTDEQLEVLIRLVKDALAEKNGESASPR